MKPFRLLFTKKLSGPPSERMLSANLDITEKEFITISPIENIELSRKIKGILEGSNTIIFTSKNAVRPISSFAEKINAGVKIFCLEGATLEEVKKYFRKETIIETAHDAATLANKIIGSNQYENLFFFCGNKRRDELPSILASHGINLKELVVYETKSSPVKMNSGFDGICFFSPSAVESYFSMNSAAEKVVFFSIGETTSMALKKFTANNILTAENSSESSMLQLVNSYVKRNNE